MPAFLLACSVIPDTDDGAGWVLTMTDGVAFTMRCHIEPTPVHGRPSVSSIRGALEGLVGYVEGCADNSGRGRHLRIVR